MKTVDIVKESRQESLSDICALFDLKRDAYYKYIKRYDIKEELIHHSDRGVNIVVTNTRENYLDVTLK